VLGPDDLIEELSLVLGPPATAADAKASDALLDAVGSSAKTLEELAEALDEPVPEVLARVARLEAAGRVTTHNGTVLTSG
jgi:predicted Rossmann fold nucleotide-binding protein DprA/Smf involved in DNA uptake